jgi:hypothetical protein
MLGHPAVSWLAFAMLVVMAARPLFARPLWFDELLGYHLSKLPTVTDVWAAVQSGADSSPPLYHALVQRSFAVFGEGAWQLRLPSLVGFLVMSACLYLFVRRHCSGLAAWAAAVAPLLTAGSVYIGEGRPYGVVLGFTSAALLCWQRSTLRPGWSPWLAGAALGVAGAAGCQFFGVLALVPLGCAEAVHQLVRCRLDLLRWLTLTPALVPSAVMIPALSNLLATTGTDVWDTPTVASFVSGYRIVWGTALMVPVAVLCVAAVLRADATEAETRQATWLPSADSLAGLGFLAIPALIVLAALVSGGPFVPRFGIAALIGFGVLAAAGTVVLERRRPQWAAVFVCALIAGFVFQIADRWRRLEPPLSLPEALAVDQSNLPIVMDGPLDYLQLAYYAPPDVQTRLVALVDPAAAYFYVGARRGDFLLARLQPFAPALRIEEPASFFARHRRFLVYQGRVRGWVLAKVVDDGARATLLRFRNTEAIFDVRLPAPPDVATSR